MNVGFLSFNINTAQSFCSTHKPSLDVAILYSKIRIINPLTLLKPRRRRPRISNTDTHSLLHIIPNSNPLIRFCIQYPAVLIKPTSRPPGRISVVLGRVAIAYIIQPMRTIATLKATIPRTQLRNILGQHQNQLGRSCGSEQSGRRDWRTGVAGGVRISLKVVRRGT